MGTIEQQPNNFSSPILIGLIIDVSGSMTKAIKNINGPQITRIDAFRKSLKDFANKGKEISQKSRGNISNSVAQVFALGYGFGNPLSIILGRHVSPVRDLLNTDEEKKAIPITEIAENWAYYEKKIEDLVIDMFGSSPLLEALEEVEYRFEKKYKPSEKNQTKVLFIVSDGKPNKGTSLQIKAKIEKLKLSEFIIVSCYFTDIDLTEPRKLYSNVHPSWPEGARLLFEFSSKIPEDLNFQHYLYEHGWNFDESARLFAQINRSDILVEFLNTILSPANRSDLESTDIFISYAHGDEDYRIELEKHLSILKRLGMITTWHDRMITPGTEWKEEIDNNIERARLIILLISENFISSNYCYGVELKRALERHENGSAMIIPVILKPVDWEGAPFAKFQMLPTDARAVSLWQNRAEAFTNVTQGIRKAIIQIKNK